MCWPRRELKEPRQTWKPYKLDISILHNIKTTQTFPNERRSKTRRGLSFLYIATTKITFKHQLKGESPYYLINSVRVHGSGSLKQSWLQRIGFNQ